MLAPLRFRQNGRQREPPPLRPRLSLRDQLENIDLQQQELVIPQRSSPSHSPISSFRAHEQGLAGDESPRPSQSLYRAWRSPGDRSPTSRSVRSRTVSPATARVRFSDELPRPDSSAFSPSRNHHQPALHLNTGLYTIQSNVDDMGPGQQSQRRGKLLGGPPANRPRRHRRPAGAAWTNEYATAERAARSSLRYR